MRRVVLCCRYVRVAGLVRLRSFDAKDIDAALLDHPFWATDNPYDLSGWNLLAESHVEAIHPSAFDQDAGDLLKDEFSPARRPDR